MKKSLLYVIAAVLAMVCGPTTASAAEVVWFDGSHPITYSLPRTVEPVVSAALEMWKDDMRQVTGLVPQPAKDAAIRIVTAQGGDDGFRLSVSNGQVVVCGFSPRGTAYALLELSRMAGVSPWIWWGDVVPERKSRLSMAADFTMEHHPSVEYRGIFLNDEDWSLRPWSSLTYEPGAKGRIGTQTYRRIFQLLLRLRANAVWPAMHEGTTAFFQLSGAKAVADSFGIVIGTSHCEPLLRNNVGEWDTAVRGRFNYRTNRQAVHDYWTERLREVSTSQGNMFTIGMRGIHDSSMEGYTTDEEKLEALQQVIDDQQQLLRRHVGDPSGLMQVFVPYKEVLQLYERGLRVPDYVTLLWCDDNYGYMTRYSSAAEQRRTGGGGVYYHLSYWGRPHDYLWLTTTQPGLIYNEMRQAYDHGMRRLWIANVHDPKVAAYDLELFLDMAWDINAVSGATLTNHYRRWLCRQFGEEAGRLLLPVMHDFFRLCAVRRPEFMGWTQVELDKKKYVRGLSPVTTVGLTRQEADVRMATFDSISAVVKQAATLVRPELSDAFFAAITYPVMATAAMNRKLLSTGTASHEAYEEIRSLTRRYNEMSHGKWRHLMDAAPRRLPVFGDVSATLAPDTLAGRTVVTHNACDYAEATTGTAAVQMLGHSMQAVAMPKDGTLTYRFSVDREGDYTLTTALVPTHPADNGDLRYSVAIDGGQPTVFSLKEPFRSERWKQNVLNCQTRRSLSVHLTAGTHTLALHALDAHVVFDQWMLVF